MTDESRWFDFKGKVVVVTGAGGGIGAAVAESFAACGASVAGIERDEQSLKQMTERYRNSAGTFLPVQADVSSEEAVAKAFREIYSRLNTVDVLVNNVGLEFYKEFVDVTMADWERQIGVNLRSVFLCCSQAAPAMIRQGSGSIINTASVQALASTGNTAPYAAAKAGILGMTRDLARDFGPHNIRVNGICPGCIETPMMDRTQNRNADPVASREKMRATIPLKRLGKPQEIANVVLFLASDLASYVSGVALPIDGGLMAQLPVV